MLARGQASLVIVLDGRAARPMPMPDLLQYCFAEAQRDPAPRLDKTNSSRPQRRVKSRCAGASPRRRNGRGERPNVWSAREPEMGLLRRIDLLFAIFRRVARPLAG